MRVERRIVKVSVQKHMPNRLCQIVTVKRRRFNGSLTQRISIHRRDTHREKERAERKTLFKIIVSIFCT